MTLVEKLSKKSKEKQERKASFPFETHRFEKKGGDRCMKKQWKLIKIKLDRFHHKEKMTLLFSLAILAVCFLGVGKYGQEATHTMLPVDQKTIVLDAGHGGWDPGKVGSGGVDEKEINLAIMERLQQYLEQGGAVVMITRGTDEALGKNKKADMAERKAIANESGGDILVSVHQNSFPSNRAAGAQVFYHKQSPAGKRLGELVQESLRSNVDSENRRQVKANSDYYILRTTEIPAVIVECGFLSNGGEEKKLNDPSYQDQLAWAIYLGIVEYFGEAGIV